MSPSDPKQGGDLFDMAKDGTSIPSDAGTQRTIPSVPRPDQKPDKVTSGGGLGAPSIASAADNATDIPRGPQDAGATGEVVTGTGDQMSGAVESKRLGTVAGNPSAKGNLRDGKFGQGKSQFETTAGEGDRVMPAPEEEGTGQDAGRDRK